MSVTEEKKNILDRIDSPADLKALSEKELDSLAAEIRERLVRTVTSGDGCLGRGGHLASNLGVVELTIALHRVFDSPRDHIIWDVGHQSYVHKLLTLCAHQAGFPALQNGRKASMTRSGRDTARHPCLPRLE